MPVEPGCPECEKYSAATEALGWYASDGRVRGALSDGRIAAMARLLEAVQVFVADWERSDGGRTIETIENDALEIVDAARAVWAEGGEG